ncbi:methionyl-tRNA formyltransferase, partial [Staphylococcus aureus]|uniref:methionyl-tRNA formyltransferase n=1 Tax=Staphylococcus aureus TaxID=1280 RepID=UPI00351F6A2F
TVPSMRECTNESVPQDDTQATFAANIRREDERISWKKPGRQVLNQMRGLSPWPVAYTTMDDTNLKIYDAELVETNNINEPGTIIETTKKAIIVATNDNEAYAIKVIQLAGKKRMLAANYLSGAQNTLVWKKLRIYKTWEVVLLTRFKIYYM